jgi:SNF2 family DNA or RNA helicase
MVAPYTYQVTKAECLDLPDKVYQRREYELSPEWLKLYGEIATEAQIPLVRDLRLHQLLGGFVVVPEARQRLMDLVASPEALAAFLESDEITYATQPAPGPNPHLEALLEALDEIDGKVVIWCRYRAEIEIIAQALTGAVQFHGGVSMEDRNAARRAFQTDTTVRYFIGQISTGGIGITLTAASVEIFYSGDWSAENRIQAEDRIHRIGQEGEHCLYIDLVARGNWIDKRILNTVQDGKDYHAEVMCDLGHLTQGSR